MLRVKKEFAKIPNKSKRASEAIRNTGINKTQIEGKFTLLNLYFMGYKITANKNPKYILIHREHTANL